MKQYKLLFLALLTAVFCIVTVSADIGNAFDDGSSFGGGDDYGYDYDYDYDNDWDWDDGYDHSYNYNNDYNYTSSGSVDFSADAVISLIIVLAILYFVYKHTQKNRNGALGKGTVQQGNPNARNLYGEAVSDEDAVIAAIRKDDPDFSAADFKAYVEDCYLRLTEAWEARDWAIARNFESDTLFHVHRSQLEEYIEQKKTNHMDGQCVLSKVLTNYRSDGKTDSVIVRLNATVIDYVTDDETGAILSGSQTQRCNRFYRLEFIRTAGIKTQKDHGLTSHECPSCGAPLNLNASGRCEYCQNVITSGDFTWVLNAYGRWN